MHPCERCGAPILEKYRVCFLCMRDAQQDADASNGQANPYYSAPRFEPKASAPSREEAIAKAHAENMAAYKSLTEAIGNLTIVINWLVDKEKAVKP